MIGLKKERAAAVTTAQESISISANNLTKHNLIPKKDDVNPETKDTPISLLIFMDLLKLTPDDLCLNSTAGVTYKTKLIIDMVAEKLGEII